jgi:Right handed beta helix region
MNTEQHNKIRLRRKKHLIHCCAAVLVAVYISCSGKPPATNYYFDSVTGKDANKGTCELKPFRSLSRIKELKLNPGDSILLKGGSVFREELQLTCHGSGSLPVVLGRYGSAERPFIAVDGKHEAAVHILNSEHLVIRDLEISNNAGKPVPGLHGLWVELNNYGTAHDIRIDNLFVHDVSGSCTREEKDGGHAILIQNYHEESPDTVLSNFEGMVIENCRIKDCSRSGIIFWGNWIRSKWKPSTGVIIRHNLLEGVPGDGIVPVGCDGVRVEYNVMRNCPPALPVTEAADGIWPWSCDNALIQYNVVSDHKSPVDAYGFDSDWNSNNSVFQYNLSFNNDGGFLLICNSGGWPRDWCIGNNGTLVRYNISINDGQRNYKLKEHYFSPVIHCTGPIKNSTIEKNLFCLFTKPDKKTDKTLISLTDWKGYPDSTFFRNNFIYAEEKYDALDPGKSTHTVCEKNFYVGNGMTEKGFESHPGPFDWHLWRDEKDKNWDSLLRFISDKKVIIQGKELNVTDIIGVNPRIRE